MANAFYNRGKEGFLDGSIDMDTDSIRVFAVDADYTFSAAHDFIDDVATASMVGGNSSGLPSLTATLGSKTVTNGVFDAADSTLSSVTNATQAIAVIIYKHNTTAANSRLIAYIDTASGLPFLPNGGNVTIGWNASGIFAL